MIIFGVNREIWEREKVDVFWYMIFIVIGGGFFYRKVKLIIFGFNIEILEREKVDVF